MQFLKGTVITQSHREVLGERADSSHLECLNHLLCLYGRGLLGGREEGQGVGLTYLLFTVCFEEVAHITIWLQVSTNQSNVVEIFLTL